jgi:hypothetical protein
MANAIAADRAHGDRWRGLVTGIGILTAFGTEVAGGVRRGQRARTD